MSPTKMRMLAVLICMGLSTFLACIWFHMEAAVNITYGGWKEIVYSSPKYGEFGKNVLSERSRQERDKQPHAANDHSSWQHARTNLSEHGSQKDTPNNKHGQSVPWMQELSNMTKHKTWPRADEQNGTRPNILFIIADDLRPDIGIYNELAGSKGSPWLNQKIYSPNLDKLASRSVLFTRAYSQQAQCNPSRSSLLTSRRPDTTMVHNNTVFFRMNNPDIVSLPQYFKSKDYVTLCAGKVFHARKGIPGKDIALSWSSPCLNRKRDELFQDENRNIWTAISDIDLKASKLLDEMITTQVIRQLDNFAQQTPSERRPFFLAIGMKTTHLPLIFPKRFLDFYPLDSVSMPNNPTAAKDMPSIAWHRSQQVRSRREFKKFAPQWDAASGIPLTTIRDLRRAYYAAISYMDELIGKVVDKLESTRLGNNTIIVFTADHGFHLGEQSIVGKNTVFEVAANVPLMISVPHLTSTGKVRDHLVELVDIFPTLVDLAGFESLPYCPKRNSNDVDICTEGTSLLPLFDEVAGKTSHWKDSVFYQYPHYLDTSNSSLVCMGYTIRTARYRYTEWTPCVYQDTNVLYVERKRLCGVELYDHQSDPHETSNIAHSDDLKAVRAQLSDKLKVGWTEALPKP